MKTRFKLILLIFLGLAILSWPFKTVEGRKPEGLAPSIWPMFQRDIRHSGQSPYTGITSFPVLKWKQQLPGICGDVGTGFSEAMDGSILVSACGKLSAIDLESGTILWTFNGENSSRSVPAIAADGTIYWGFADSFAALTATGKIEWRWINLSGNLIFGSSPVIAEDGTIYFTHDGVFSLSADGDIRWFHPFSWFSHSSPAIGVDGTIYVGSGDGNLYAFDPNGSVKWRREISTYDNSPSIGSDGTVYIGAYSAKLYAYNPAGTFLWKFETEETRFHDSSVYGPPAISADGTIYFGTHVPGGMSDYAHIYALNGDGSLKWKFPIHRRDNLNPGIVAPLTVDREGNLFACTDNGACYGISADGNLLWEYIIEPNHWLRTAPYIYSDGKMLILDQSVLYAFVSGADRVYLPIVIGKK